MGKQGVRRKELDQIGKKLGVQWEDSGVLRGDLGEGEVSFSLLSALFISQ